MGWTAPICDECWDEQRPGERPIRMKDPAPARCAFCGEYSTSGIFTRADPDKVAFPPDRD